MEGLRLRLSVAAAVLAALVTVTPAARGAQDDPVTRAEQLTREGRAAEAYRILEPLESANAGTVRFDYALGTAALDAGHPDRAIVAFERVLAMDPNFAGARVDLGRAYFALGSDDLARNEFDAVLQVNPPPQVRALIARYIEAIEARKKKQQPAFLGYVEVGGGYDSNISAVTNNFTGGVLQAYGIANVLPTGNSIKRSGWFDGAAAGADYSRPFQLDALPGLSWYVGGDVRERHYIEQDNGAFNSEQLDARAGLAYSFENDLFKAGLQQQKYFQEGAAPLAADGTRIANDRTTFGYTFEWRHVVAPGTQFAAFGQLNEQSFQTNSIQNIHQRLWGVQVLKAFQARWNPIGVIALFTSRDRAVNPINANPDAPNVSKTLTGLRVYAQVTPRDPFDVFLSIGETDRQDNAKFARSLLTEYGQDRTFDTTLGVNYRLQPTWILRSQLSTFDNRSNISLYDYKRTEFLVTLRKEFK